jgi:hypothetical protein
MLRANAVEERTKGDVVAGEKHHGTHENRAIDPRRLVDVVPVDVQGGHER